MRMRRGGRDGRGAGAGSGAAATGRWLAAAVLVLLLAPPLAGEPAAATGGTLSRVKDLAGLEGMASEPLLGYGLVVGLGGTGDGQSADFTINSLAAMLERLNVTVDPRQLRLKNVAAVLVTARLEPGSAPGGQLDATVSSLGDATSLEGGILIMTPLKAADGRVCALAQGSVSIGGFNIRGGAGNSFRKNHATVGRIPGGAQVTSAVPAAFVREGRVSWLLHNPDFGTASRIAAVINDSCGSGIAQARDGQRIEVVLPQRALADPVPFVARMGELPALGDAPARVVINERTGTIIVGQGVRLREAAVAHGNLKVMIRTDYRVSQPNSFNESGRTVVVPEVTTDVQDDGASVVRVPDTGTVADVVGVLNEIGASPRDIIAILQALRQAGALQAELQIM